MDYHEFLREKALSDPMTGMDGGFCVPDAMNPHQKDITSWALRRGRAAVFAGTGLGKTFIELVWAENVSAYTGKPVLIFAPLAVSAQHVREGNKFGISSQVISDPSQIRDGINITNYQKIDKFDLDAFGGICLDESSILKNSTGKYRSALIEKTRNIPFRLAATATPAPNDFMELGNHAEFLGIMSETDMLSMFFTHDGGETQKWRMKGHAEDAFWRWMASWAVMLRSPSDLGYPNDGYDLPPLRQHQHLVAVKNASEDKLFPMEARTLKERIVARRESVEDRCRLAASLTPEHRPFVWWCNLNAESETLARMIPGAVEVRGSDKDAEKERKLIEFSEGKIRVLITKPSIAGFGMNWQHCADTGFVGLTDSFEQVYQAIRRFWRFGQESPVNVHFIAAETEGAVVSNIKRKEANADRMADRMVRHMADLTSENVKGLVRDRAEYQPAVEMQLPNWVK